MYWKRSKPNCNGNRHDKMALKTTCIKNVKFKIVKMRTSCQNIGYFYHSENLNWAAQNRWLGRGLDIAGMKPIEIAGSYTLLWRVTDTLHVDHMIIPCSVGNNAFLLCKARKLYTQILAMQSVNGFDFTFAVLWFNCSLLAHHLRGKIEIIVP